MSRLSFSWTWHQLPHFITPALEYAPMGTFRAVRLHLLIGMFSLTIGPKPARLPLEFFPRPDENPDIGALRTRLREQLTRKDHQK